MDGRARGGGGGSNGVPAESHLRKRDLVCEGPHEVKKRAKLYLGAKGDFKQVNRILADEYRGDADACTLLAACAVGLPAAVGAAKPPPHPRSIILGCLHQSLKMSLADSGLAELDRVILRASAPPKWLDKVMRDPAFNSMLCDMWAAGGNPDSVFLNYALLKLRKSVERAMQEEPPGAAVAPAPAPAAAAATAATHDPHITAVLAARFPDVLKHAVLGAAGSDAAARARHIATMLAASRIDYHVLLYVTLLLSELAADRASEEGCVAARALDAVQGAALAERGSGAVDAAFPFAHPTARDLMRDDTLWTSDIKKVEAAGVDVVAACPALLDRIVAEAAGSEPWRAMLVRVKAVLCSRGEDPSADVEGFAAALTDAAAFLNDLHREWLVGHEANDVLKRHTRLLQHWASRCALASLMCVKGLCRFIAKRYAALGDAATLATWVLALRCVLGMMEVRPALAAPDTLRTCLHTIIVQAAGAVDPWQEGAAIHAVAAYLVAAALAPSPLPYVAFLTSDPAALATMNKTVLHVLLTLFFVYIPPPYSPPMRRAVAALVDHPGVADALRTSLPDMVPFRPKGTPPQLLDYRELIAAHQTGGAYPAV